jgi:hydroxyethylthiazole kinase
MAGFAAVEEDPLVAAAASLAVAGIAGEIASETAGGPGSFAAAMLDALARLDADLIEQRARIA